MKYRAGAFLWESSLDYLSTQSNQIERTNCNDTEVPLTSVSKSETTSVGKSAFGDS